MGGTNQIGLPARGAYVLAANAANLMAILGYRDDEADGKSWRLVKAKTPITDGPGKAVNFLITAGAISWKVALTATLGSLVVAGIIDPTMATTVDLPVSAVFWVQRAGEALAWCHTTVTATTNGLTTITTTAGYLGKAVFVHATSAIIDQKTVIGHAQAAFATVASRVKVRLDNIY